MKAVDQPRGAPKADKQVVGNKGLYFVCYRLSQLGWNVMPTTRNARGVDVLIYSQAGNRKATIQVKALSKRDPVPLGANLSNLIADYFVICNRVAGNAPTCFILLPEEVRHSAHRGERNGKVSYWLQPADYDVDEFREQWQRIGDGYDGARPA